MRYMPKGYGELLKICVKLNRNEGLVFAPVEGEGTKIFIHHTNPPEWLLEAHRRAKENTRLMMVKSERERYILQRIGELTENGLPEILRYPDYLAERRYRAYKAQHIAQG